MMIVIDANAVISALLKNGKSRQIIVSGKFTFVAPDYISEEVHKHKKEIAERAGISEGEVELLTILLFRRIMIVPSSEYKDKLAQAVRLMKDNLKDVPYTACYLALKCEGIWTNDTGFDGIYGIKVFRTEELMRLL